MPLRLPSTAHQTAALGPAERTQFYRRKLHRLMEITEAMAELTLASAQRDAANRAPEPTTEPTAVIERLGRCMRRTIMLDRILDNPVPTRRIANDDNPDTNRRHGVIDATPQHRPPPEPTRPNNDTLDRERPERLDRPDFLIDLTKTTPAEIITEIEAELCLEGEVVSEDFITPQDLEDAFKRILKQYGAPRPQQSEGPDHPEAEPVDPDDTG